MARVAVAGRATIAGTAALPLVSLYGVSTVRAKISEIGVFNTTAVAVAVAVNRLSTAGTQGAPLTEVATDEPEYTPLATAFAGPTVGPTVGGAVRQASLGAAIGSGVIWTFPERLEIAAATTAGIGILIPTGTGQILDYYIVWDE
jgi:hypothetical protein